MRGVRIGRWVKLRRVIVNEGASIPEGETIGFDIAEDCRRFHVTEGGVVIVQAGAAPTPRTSSTFALENAAHFV